MFGKLLSSVVKIANAPIRAAEDLVGADSDEERLFSKSDDALAKELDRADKDEDDD